MDCIMYTIAKCHRHIVWRSISDVVMERVWVQLQDLGVVSPNILGGDNYFEDNYGISHTYLGACM